MKKIVFVLVALVVAAPAFGDAVNITATQVGSTNDVDITYSAPGKLPRAFALDITVDSGAKITRISNFLRGESTSDSNGYGIFPASFDRHINPADPNWNDVNYTPVAEPNDLPGDTLGGLETNGITIEMGSLYAGPNEGPNSPATSGTLCRITVDGGCTVSLSANVGRGKVVFEDSTEASPINLFGCTVILQVTVPDVLAMNETDATAAIEANDLNAVVVAYECNDVELADEVLAQNPIGGTVVTSGSDVNLWVSTGQPNVPDVVGDANQAAQDAINAVTYLSVGDVTPECNDSIANGIVISQDPGEGYTACDTDVNLVISTGSPTVPDVVGDANQAAQDAINAVSGLSVGDITTECNDTIADGNVISTDPAAGAATCGTDVNIVISTGSPVVPDVVGDANQAAQDAINAVPGLSVGDITTEPNGTIADGNVIRTDPAAGATTCGTDVNIVIAGCGDCPLDISSWDAGVPDDFVGPEDLQYLLTLINGCAYQYCDITGLTDAEACLDVSSWDAGVPDGYVGPEDLQYLLTLINGCAYQYCACP